MNKDSILTGKLSGWSGSVFGSVMLIVTLFPASTSFAHTPYAQWDAYRERHFQVLSARTDLVGDSIADQWVAVLTEHLPASKAVVSRARNMVRIASLLKTDQAKVAVLSYTDAKAMSEGAGQFEEFGPLPLQLLVDDGSYLLVTRSDLPEEHGFMVVSTLMEDKDKYNLSVPVDGLFGMPVHPGAFLALEGKR